MYVYIHVYAYVYIYVSVWSEVKIAFIIARKEIL